MRNSIFLFTKAQVPEVLVALILLVFLAFLIYHLSSKKLAIQSMLNEGDDKPILNKQPAIDNFVNNDELMIGISRQLNSITANYESLVQENPLRNPKDKSDELKKEINDILNEFGKKIRPVVVEVEYLYFGKPSENFFSKKASVNPGTTDVLFIIKREIGSNEGTFTVISNIHDYIKAQQIQDFDSFYQDYLQAACEKPEKNIRIPRRIRTIKDGEVWFDSENWIIKNKAFIIYE